MYQQNNQQPYQNQGFIQYQKLPYMNFVENQVHTLLLEKGSDGPVTTRMGKIKYFYTVRDMANGQSFTLCAAPTLHQNIQAQVRVGSQFTISLTKPNGQIRYILNGQPLQMMRGTRRQYAQPAMPPGMPPQGQSSGYPPNGNYGGVPEGFQQPPASIVNPTILATQPVQPAMPQVIPLSTPLTDREQSMVTKFKTAGWVGPDKQQNILLGLKTNGCPEQRAMEIYSNFLAI